MYPKARKVAWDDPEVGERLHLIPYSLLSDQAALAVEVIYVRDADYAGSFFYQMEGWPNNFYIAMSYGLSIEQRRYTLWHELAHCLEITEFDPVRGERLVTNARPRFSCRGGHLEPLLEYYADVINRDPKRFASFDDFNPPGELSYLESDPSLRDDCFELFARAVVLSVFYPLECIRVMPELHKEIAKILFRELSTRIPMATMHRFQDRLLTGRQRRFPIINGAAIGTKRKPLSKVSKGRLPHS